jgi:hypothetical protein
MSKSRCIKAKRLFVTSINGNAIAMDVQRWISFEDFVTPSIITIVYVLGVIVITLASLFILLGGSFMGSMGGGGAGSVLVSFIMALLVFVFGNIYLRVLCEVLIVIFKIHDHLNSIDNYFIAMRRNS